MLDSQGRAEMKYRESDSKSYRPLPGNLSPDGGGPPVSTRPSSVRAGPARTRAPKKKEAGRPHPLGGAVEIWTDGACSGNPGPMGIGVVVLDGAARRELGEYLGLGTNNIAELVAIERGLDLAAQLEGSGPRPLRVYTDSGYSIGVLGKGWKAKANQELIARIKRRLQALVDVEFVKVAGHAGVPENERCDELARQAIAGRAR
jgi:ribonuclease HI